MIALFVSLTACASDNGTGEFQHELDNASAELGRHLSACNAAATDTGMNQEMARHDDAMQSLMGMMGMRFDQMGHCYHGDAATMKGLMSEVLGAEQTHREHMTDAKSLDDAQAECQRYVTEAGADIDQMRQRYQHEGAQCMMMMM